MAARDKVRILYMEGAADRKKSVRQYLKKKGFAVDVAATGRRGLAAVKGRTYDAVIISSNLADMDGLDALRTMSRRREMPPTIVVSAPDNPRRALMAMKLGALDCVVSPDDKDLPMLLKASVERILENRTLTKE